MQDMKEFFLKNGSYKYNDDFTQIHLINDKHEIDHFKSKGIVNSLKRLIRKVKHIEKIEIDSNEKYFEGKILLYPSNNYGFKVFSELEIATYFKNKYTLEQIISNRKKISEIFKVPKIIKIENNIIFEKKVENVSCRDDYEKVKYFMNSYINFFESKKVERTFLKLNCLYKYRFMFIFKSFYKKILCDEVYNTVIQHGDMWTNNILYDGDSFYIIDFENVGEKYILFDFFTFIYNKALIDGSYIELEKYFGSKYDYLLEKYFKSLNIEYNTNNKKKYFYTYLNIILHEKFIEYSNHHFVLEILKMIKIVKKIEREQSHVER